MPLIEATIVGGQELALRFTAMSSTTRDRLIAAMEDAQRLLLNNIKSNELSGQALNVRSGTLRRSGTVDPIESSATRITRPVGFNTAYARIQDIGGTVHASGKKLTIPMEAVLTSRGVPRYSAPEIIGDPSMDGFDRVVFLAHMLYGVINGTTEPKSMTPLFAIVDEATIPAVQYLRRGLDDSKDAIVERLEMALAGAVRE